MILSMTYAGYFIQLFFMLMTQFARVCIARKEHDWSLERASSSRSNPQVLLEVEAGYGEVHMPMSCF